MKRREWLKSAGMAGLGMALASSPFKMASAADAPKRKLLFFTRSAGFEHSVIKTKDAKTGEEKQGHAHKVLAALGEKNNFEITHTKDGGVFTPENIAKYDAFFFYTTGVLTGKGGDGNPPMSPEGKEALLEAIKNGKGFLGSHSATDTFHATTADADRYKNFGDKADPYIQMIGGEFIHHGAQQKAKMVCADSKFPGFGDLKDGVELMDEWYSLKDFADNLHVILVQETTGMKGPLYERAPYPATWARAHGKGRVFYTSMGHREDVWTNPIFQNILTGAISWATGNIEADITPNIKTVTPNCLVLPKPEPPKPK